jgi:hypothetical protein
MFLNYADLCWVGGSNDLLPDPESGNESLAVTQEFKRKPKKRGEWAATAASPL